MHTCIRCIDMNMESHNATESRLCNTASIAWRYRSVWTCFDLVESYIRIQNIHIHLHIQIHICIHIQIHIHNYINIYVHLYPLTEYLQPNYPKSCVYARIIYLHSRCELLSKSFRHNWPPASVSKRSSRSLSNGVKLHAITSLQKIGSSN